VGRAIAVFSLAGVLPVFIGYTLFQRDEWPRRPLVGPVLTRILRFGLAGQVGNIVQTLSYRLDAYLVLLFVDTGGVGIYAIGVSLSEALWLIANSVASVLLPRLSGADDAYVERMTPLVCRTTLLATLLGACALAAAAPVFVPLLFGARFDAAILPLLLLLPGTVALAAAKVLSAYIFSRGKPFTNTLIAVATFVTMVLCDVALIPLFGVEGAAVASTLAYGLSLALTAAAYRGMSGRPVTQALLPMLDDVRVYRETMAAVVARLRPAAAAGNS
jgi:O-antigen/teichoic acid export membrane protein